MKRLGMAMLMIAAALMMAATALAQGEIAPGQGRAVVTVLAKHGASMAQISQQAVSVKVNGKESSVTGWVPFKSADDRLELVVLIDSEATKSLDSQFGDIRQFIQGLGPNAKVAIAYMQNGRAFLAGPLSTDHAQALRGLRLAQGPSASPYFCLSNLAKNWPSVDRGARRVVVMVTDGVDPFYPNYDPQDTYVESATDDSIRAGLVVYSIFWSNLYSTVSTGYTVAGQSLQSQLTQATGGKSYWIGMGNPVSFQPYFEDLARRLGNQYELDFTARQERKPTMEYLKLKVEGPSVEIAAPQKVFVD